jgi:DNA polymerase-3 subunit alpha
MVFPQSYQAASSLLIDDAVIVVRARADRSDDDGLRLIAMEVTAPDLSEAASGPVRITMATSRLVPPLSDRLKEVLSGYPGTTEVHLHLDDGNRVAVMRLGDRFRVTASPALYGDLKALLGAACLS